MPQKKIKVGTRGSALATTQTGMVIESLKQANPGVEIECVEIVTGGDSDQKTPLHNFASQGVFIKELEEALYRKEIDIAVHSLKDVPHELPEQMLLAAFYDREDPRDAFISKYKSISELPKGATVGTGSPRRIIQLKALRNDLKFVELRGNIDTRIKKAETGEFDAVILACAGLDRMGWEDRITQRIETDEMLPAIGQGIVALETRADDEVAIKIARGVDRPESRMMAITERNFMEKMGGGCKVPLAALGIPRGESLRFTAVLGDLKTGETLKMVKDLKSKNIEAELNVFIDEFSKACKVQGLVLPSEVGEHKLIEDTESFFGR
jgi:hydroxymethylbilane synthase